MIGLVGLMVFDPRKKSFRPWSIAGDAVSFGDRYKVLRPRQYECISYISRDIAGSVTRNSFRRLSTNARDREVPSQPVVSIPVTGAVAQTQLWLKSVPSRRHGDGNAKVAGPSMEIRRKRFT